MGNRTPRITNGQRAAFCGLMIAGLAFRDAAAVADVSQQLIHGFLPDGWLDGSPPVRRYASWKGAKLEELRVAYADTTISGVEVAARFGMHREYLFRLAAKKGFSRARSPAFVAALPADQRRTYEKLRKHGIPRQEALAAACQQ